MSSCCKILSSTEWDRKEVIWRDKPFYKTRYRSFFHIPLNIGKKIVESIGKIEEAGLAAEQMMLSRHSTMWGADLLIPIKNKTDIFEIELISGRFLTRLFEGHYGDIGKWIKEMRKYCLEKGFKSEELIFWYATCPKCAKSRGDRAQAVVFAKVE